MSSSVRHFAIGTLLLAIGATSAQAEDQSAKTSQLLETRSCEGCDFTGADLSGALLIGGELNGAIFDGADLSGARLSQSALVGASFVGANLQGAILNDADLSNADFSGANMSESRLLEASLENANLSGTNLTGSKFRQTNISGAVLTRADLSNASVQGWKDDGTYFCETIEPNGTPINRDCGKAPPKQQTTMAAAASNESKEDAVQVVLPTDDATKRAADWTIISDVGRAQRILSKLGYSVGTVDGVWGGNTRRGLEKFLNSVGETFDGELSENELEILESAAAEQGISPHPRVGWDYRSAMLEFGGYEFADQPVFEMIKTIRDMPSYGLNTVSLNFHCLGKIESSLPDEYPLGRRTGCKIANKPVSTDEGFASTRRDATSLAIDEARAAGLAVNLRPMFLELGRRFGPKDASGYGTVPLDVFFDGDGQTWAGYVPIMMAIAQYAQENKVEYLTIGIELNNLNEEIENDGRWPKIVEQIRSIYDGKLIYAHAYRQRSNLRALSEANVKHHVDIVGLNYFPNQIMGGRRDYSAEAVARALTRVNSDAGYNMMSEAERLQSELGVPIVLTETAFPTWRGSANWIFRGSCDNQNAGRKGWQYTQGPLQAKTPSDQHGRLLAAGFMLAFEEEEWVHGADYVFWSVAWAFDDTTDKREYGPCSSWLWNSDDGIKEMIREFHGD